MLKDVPSPDRLFDEPALFRHRVVNDLQQEKQKLLARQHHSREVVPGRNALVVDDDTLKSFALTTLLENYEMVVLSATNGRQAIDSIDNEPGFDVVLLGIIMPEMDGHRTMRQIRSKQEFDFLPSLALTAKARKGDRKKCLNAGDSDYITKPVNTDQLVSLWRVWLYR